MAHDPILLGWRIKNHRTKQWVSRLYRHNPDKPGAWKRAMCRAHYLDDEFGGLAHSVLAIYEGDEGAPPSK